MAGRLLNTIVNILFLTYIILLISFFFLQETLKNNINELNYSTLDSVATTGVFSEDMYSYLKEQVFRFGGGTNYQLIVKYDKKIKPGVYDSYWKRDSINAGNLDNSDKNDEILTRVGRPIPMQIGDKVTVYLEAQDQTLFIRLLNAPFLGMANEYMDARIKSQKTIVVGKNAKSIVKGYELTAELKEKAALASPWTNKKGNPVAVKVKTETNQIGKYYSTNGSTVTIQGENILFNVSPINIAGQLYNFSNSYDESVANMGYNQATNFLGENHIFLTGEYYRQVVEYYAVPEPIPAGEELADYEKVIEFTQK